MMPYLLAVLLGLGPLGPGGAQVAPCQVQDYRPDANCTPGAILPATVAEVCVPGYSSGVRNVTQAERLQVLGWYGSPVTVPRGSRELDHLISLELGGSNAPENLWPQSYLGPWNAHDKDRLENFARAGVCRGELTLADVQQRIAADWMALYRDLLGSEPTEVD